MTIQMSGLTKSYGRDFTLGPVDIALTPGVTCLVGSNGAGKSTLFRLVAGLERPTSGTVTRPTGSAAVGYLPQDVAFPRQATCAAYLSHVAWLYGVPRADRAASIDDALTSVGLITRRSSRISSLSGGMQRRLGIAHALLHAPELVLLDEPTVGLDPLQRVEIRDTVRAAAAGRVVLLSTHLVEDVRAIADRVVVLRTGDLVYDGTVAELEALDDGSGVGESALERAVTRLMAEAPEPVSAGTT